MAGRKRLTAAVKQTFLDEIARGFSLEHAARCAGVTRRAFYEMRFNDDGTLTDFGRDVADAVDAGTQTLIDEARRRAFDGVEKPVTVAGQREVVRDFSDNLLMFLIKQRDPSFRENHRVEIVGDASAPVRVEVESGRVTSIGDVLELARALGAGLREGLSPGSPGAALPAAPAVLPDPGDG